MENPATWKPIHHSITEALNNNQDSEMLPYELIAYLQQKNFLPENIDSGSEEVGLVELIENAIWEHQLAIEKGQYGISLPMRLGNLLESFKSKK